MGPQNTRQSKPSCPLLPRRPRHQPRRPVSFWGASRGRNTSGWPSAQGACHQGLSSSKDGGRPEGTPSPATPDTCRGSWLLAALGPAITVQALPVVIVPVSPTVTAEVSPGESLAPGPDSGLWPRLRSPPGPAPVPPGLWGFGMESLMFGGWPEVSGSCPAAICAGTVWTEDLGIPNPQAL